MKRLFRKMFEHWCRVSAAARVILGFATALVLVAAYWTTYAREQKTLLAEREALAKAVDSENPETDEELSRLRRDLESEKANLRELKGRISGGDRPELTRGEGVNNLVVSEIDGMLSKRDLRIRERRQVDVGRVTDAASLEFVGLFRHRYEVAGSFGSVFGFLRDLADIEYLCLIDDIHLRIREQGTSESPEPPTVTLAFTVTIYYRKGGDAA